MEKTQYLPQSDKPTLTSGFGGISSMKQQLAHSKVKHKHQIADSASAGDNCGGFCGGLGAPGRGRGQGKNELSEWIPVTN